MKFGVRQICNVVFKAKANQKIGNMLFRAGQPVLYIDTATTSTLEGEATTVYAQGGRGNARLIAWEGEKALTFTVEDALLSPIGFAILSGAGLIHDDGNTADHTDTKHAMQHVHMTASQIVDTNGDIDLTDALGVNEVIAPDAPIFAVVAEADGSVTGELITNLTAEGKKLTGADEAFYGKTVFVDFYVDKNTHDIYELQIDAEHFGGYFYVEADTLFRDQATGKDMPANITLPNVKIQSNFTFEMSSTGDPSTFTFTMDAFPGYTMFDRKKKVMCVIQIINETIDVDAMNNHTLMPNNGQTEDGLVKDFEDKDYLDSRTDGQVKDEETAPVVPGEDEVEP